MPIQKNCQQCDKTYSCSPSKATSRKYCSTKCSILARIKYHNLTDNERTRQYYNTWKHNNPERASEQHNKRFIKFYGTTNGRATHLLNNVRSRAKNNNVTNSLTKEWIRRKLEYGKCEVTNIPFAMNCGYGKGHTINSFSPSIDRIDQTGPYSPENCRMVVWIYNRARGAFPDADFQMMIDSLK